MMRVVGFILGALFFITPIVFLFLGDDIPFQLFPGIFLGAVFMAYGIGGQGLLRRVAPRYAEKEAGPESSFDDKDEPLM